MNVSIDHPTDRPNFSKVTVGSLNLWFSYQTVIAYREGWEAEVIRENDWSQTTGKHLNYLDNGRKSGRLPSDLFEQKLSKVLARLDAPAENETGADI